MTLDQYISTGASAGSFLAAFATFLTVWQIAKQRKATYRPDVVVKRARVIVLEEDRTDDQFIAPLLKWRHDEQEVDSQPSFLGHDYSLLLVNIGLGAATTVAVTWDFPMVSFVAATGMLAVNSGYPERIEFKNGAVSVTKPQITSYWQNQRYDHFDYLVPASIDKEPAKLDLPSAYILAVATRMALFLGVLPNSDREEPDIPPLQLFLEFNDIAGRRHCMRYEIEFHWFVATPHAFEAELIPKRT
ncbi:hypothetical protein UP09_17105 [Bradyrhizobium sp. LTSP885]|uniref:hypothetical protein n=1 Tax=Bradyrhizobium sp. LTSP885 TaxID=1619232 RepID=UPI0005C9A6BC|nr:hypothetical protein [Bradyrhizobium sp. LTSP885]KJC43694.1 hypothetical protein UP09_17105 [Bradyrhizobium sp. LTSP885]